MLKTIVVAAVLIGGNIAGASAETRMENGVWSGRNGRDAYASQMDRRVNRQPAFQAQSGGNGSPVSAGSIRGSTDRSSPDSPYASGPYGDGEMHGRY